MKRLLTLSLWLLAVPAFGQTLTLPPQLSSNPGQFIKIPATTDCATIKWYALDSGLNLFPVDLLKDTKTAVVTGTVPGSYRLMAVGAKGDVPTEPAICTVTILGAQPAPPTPVPTPTPAPAPAAIPLFLVTIDQGTQRTLPTATLLGNVNYWQGLVSKGHKYAQIDSTNTAAGPFAKWTATTGFPALIVMEQDGTVLDAVKLPADTSGVDAEISKFSTKKGN